jgi:hypothetical protein
MRLFTIMGHLSIVAILAICGASASATSYGADVTLWDNINGTGAWTGGPTNPDPRTDALGDPTREDQEVAVGALSGQQWDLEGMYFDYGTHVLTLAGGYNFKDGVLYGGHTYTGGDIFLAVNPVLAAAPGGIEAPNPTGAGFDYVIDIDYALGTYQVYSVAGLTVGAGLIGVTDIHSSNPWLYDAASGLGTDLGIGGTVSFSGPLDQGTFAATLGAGPGEYTPVGGTHYIMSGFDLSWLYSTLGAGDFIYAHYTYECGNDLLTGYIPVPLPGAALLGLLGGAMVIAKRRFSKGAVVA